MQDNGSYLASLEVGVLIPGFRTGRCLRSELRQFEGFDSDWAVQGAAFGFSPGPPEATSNPTASSQFFFIRTSSTSSVSLLEQIEGLRKLLQFLSWLASIDVLICLVCSWRHHLGVSKLASQ